MKKDKENVYMFSSKKFLPLFLTCLVASLVWEPVTMQADCMSH